MRDDVREYSALGDFRLSDDAADSWAEVVLSLAESMEKPSTPDIVSDGAAIEVKDRPAKQSKRKR